MKKLSFVCAIVFFVCGSISGCNREERKQQSEFLSVMKFSEEAQKTLDKEAVTQQPVAVDTKSYLNGDEVFVDGIARPLELSTEPYTSSVVKLTPLAPANFQQVCAGQNLVQCSGHVVHGTGYVSLALSGQDYQVISDGIEFRLLRTSPLPKLHWFDKVEFSGVLQVPNTRDSRIMLSDATITSLPFKGNDMFVRQRRAVLLSATCLDESLQESANYSLGKGWEPSVSIKDYSFTKSTVNIARPLTGVVIAKTVSNTQACVIENGVVKASFVLGTVSTPYSLKEKKDSEYLEYEYKVWLDRAKKFKESKEFEIAREKEEAKKKDEFEALSDHDKFKRASDSLASSAEAIASHIGKKQNAQFNLEACNEEMRMGIDSYKSTGRASAMRGPEKFCAGKAIDLCMGDYDNKACERMRNKAVLPW